MTIHYDIHWPGVWSGFASAPWSDYESACKRVAKELANPFFERIQGGDGNDVTICWSRDPRAKRNSRIDEYHGVRPAEILAIIRKVETA